MERLLCLLAGYVCGGFLTAELVARHCTGKSAAYLGTGNPGMANLAHELGEGYGDQAQGQNEKKAVLILKPVHNRPEPAHQAGLSQRTCDYDHGSNQDGGAAGKSGEGGA